MLGHGATHPEPSGADAVQLEGCGFQHETLFYDGEAGFLKGTLPFVRQGIAQGEPVLVAVSRERIQLLEYALGEEAGAVLFADMHTLGSNPARIIPAWRRFLDDHAPDGRPVRGIGEPIWPGRSDSELTECQRHESLLNVAFDEGPAWRLLCPYDMGSLDHEVIRAAEESHPFVSDGSISHRNESYLHARDTDGPFAGELPAPGAHHQELQFTGEDLGRARRLVRRFAADAGLPGARIDDLVLAVDELASNSIYHGGGLGTLRIWREDGTLLCEVCDRGQITEPLVGRIHPAADQWTGRGLWLVHHLCDLVQIRSSADGSVVRVHLSLR
jgi:anti-sigma regulatory factor (Ser/Thr protein kinase)